MTPEQARYILNIWLEESMSFPIEDEIIYNESDGNHITDYTFLGLIKITYNLKEA